MPAQLLTGANARLDQSDAVAQTSGPVLSGGLVALLSAPWAVLVDAASYLVSGDCCCAARCRSPTWLGSVRGIRREAVEGLRWVYLHATLRPLALSTHAWFLCSAVGSAILPPNALRTLGLSPFGLGFAFAAGGAGGLIGSLAATRALTSCRRERCREQRARPHGRLPVAPRELAEGIQRYLQWMLRSAGEVDTAALFVKAFWLRAGNSDNYGWPDYAPAYLWVAPVLMNLKRCEAIASQRPAGVSHRPTCGHVPEKRSA